jgi:hypothetical protein
VSSVTLPCSDTASLAGKATAAPAFSISIHIQCITLFIKLLLVITKIKIAGTIIFPTVTYGSESWTVRKRERKKIGAFELWTCRRILRVPWTEKRTKLSVLEEVKPKRSLEATILRLK